MHLHSRCFGSAAAAAARHSSSSLAASTRGAPLSRALPPLERDTGRRRSQPSRRCSRSNALLQSAAQCIAAGRALRAAARFRHRRWQHSFAERIDWRCLLPQLAEHMVCAAVRQTRPAGARAAAPLGERSHLCRCDRSRCSRSRRCAVRRRWVCISSAAACDARHRHRCCTLRGRCPLWSSSPRRPRLRHPTPARRCFGMQPLARSHALTRHRRCWSAIRHRLSARCRSAPQERAGGQHFATAVEYDTPAVGTVQCTAVGRALDAAAQFVIVAGSIQDRAGCSVSSSPLSPLGGL